MPSATGARAHNVSNAAAPEEGDAYWVSPRLSVIQGGGDDGFSTASARESLRLLRGTVRRAKVLELQYTRGLECLNEALPQTEVRLVFKQKRLQYEPPLEEIRTAHYKAIKAFLNLPLTHKVRALPRRRRRPGLLHRRVGRLWEAVGMSARLRLESFGTPRRELCVCWARSRLTENHR